MIGTREVGDPIMSSADEVTTECADRDSNYWLDRLIGYGIYQTIERSTRRDHFIKDDLLGSRVRFSTKRIMPTWDFPWKWETELTPYEGLIRGFIESANGIKALVQTDSGELIYHPLKDIKVVGSN